MTTVRPAVGELTFPAFPAGLDTPRVVVDLARVAANIDRLQAEMDARGIALRPHAKTHKSVAVARMQLAAGARGITVGTLGEANDVARAESRIAGADDKRRRARRVPIYRDLPTRDASGAGVLLIPFVRQPIRLKRKRFLKS